MASSSKYSTIQLDAGRDISGNPERVFVVFRKGVIVAVYDEGYEGESIITNKYHRAAYAGRSFLVPKSEYTRMLEVKEKLEA